MEKKEVEKSGKVILGKIKDKSIKILRILKDYPEGIRVNKIIKFTGFSQRTAYNNLESLRAKGLVESIFPIWRIVKHYALSDKMAKLLDSDAEIQAHKFKFILKLINKPDWWDKRENQLIKLKDFEFKPVVWNKRRNNKYEMLASDNFLIQTFSNSIIFINQKKYWALDSYEAFIEALEDTLEMLRFLEERVKFKFFNDGIPQFSVSSSHFVKLKDLFAKKCAKKGDFFRLEINGNLRALIDKSDPFGTEFVSKNHNVEDSHRHLKVMEEYIEKNAPTPLEIEAKLKESMELLSKSSQNQINLSQVIEQISNNLIRLTKEVADLKNANSTN